MASPWTDGPACAQITTLGAFAGPAKANEDCLTLNVFTPTHNHDDKRGVRDRAPLRLLGELVRTGVTALGAPAVRAHSCFGNLSLSIRVQRRSSAMGS